MISDHAARDHRPSPETGANPWSLASPPPPFPTPKASWARNIHIPYLYLALSSPSVSGLVDALLLDCSIGGANLEF
jgi:hypothetical protein